VAIAIVVAVRAAVPATEKPTAEKPNTEKPIADKSPTDENRRPAPTISEQPASASIKTGEQLGSNLPPPAPAGSHPLDTAIETAQKILDHLHKDIKDYTCVIDKQTRHDGTLGEPQFMESKVRQQPFSVYLKFLAPADVRGREVIFVTGANNGNLLVRDGSGWTRSLGTLSLNPTGPIAMKDARYPITDIGLTHLTERLLEIARQDRRYGEVEVHYFSGAKVNDRTCTLIEVMHPIERRVFLFYKAQIYIDDQLNLPIRYTAYMWPKHPGEDPPLDEAYTYLNLKLNVGLTDADFDPHNPKYHFVDQ
jgi:hypothetical protein